MDMTMFRRRGLLLSTPHIVNESGSIVTFDSAYNKIPIKSLICNIEPIQEGTGDPSPENVRPISGRSGLNVMQAGKNLIQHFIVNDITASGLTLSLRDDGTILISGTPTNGSTASLLNRRTFNRGDIRLKAGTYTFKITSDNPYIYAQVVTYDNGTFFSRTGASTKTIETDFDVLYIDIGINPNNGENVNVIIKPQLELGSAATDYEPYKGSTYSVNWESEAGTVYGGYVDIASGKLVVDRAMVDLGTLSWTTYSSPDRHIFRSSYPTPLPFIGDYSLPPHAISSSYYPMAYDPISGYDNGAFSFGAGRTVVIDHRFSDVASFGGAVNGVQLCYELATPTEIQLTPQEVKTLLGVNSIWCDSGDVSVDYWKWGK